MDFNSIPNFYSGSTYNGLFYGINSLPIYSNNDPAKAFKVVLY